MITVMPVNGFTGTVTLTTSVSPATGLNCSVSPSSITGGSGTSTLTCTGTGGTYTVTVTGTSGSLVHTAMVTVNVADFTLTASPTSATVNTGSAATSNITVQAVGGFTGTVTLSVTTNSTNLTCTLTPTSIAGGSGSSTLSCSSTISGDYLANVTGSSGSLSHSATFTVHVQQVPQGTPPSLTQVNFKHRLSLSKSANTQTFKVGALNPNNVTIYVNFQIVATDGQGVNGFTINSGVIALAPSQNLTNVVLSVFIPNSDIGDTFNWTLSIQWGTTATTDPSQLPNNGFTDVNGIPTSGSFTVLA
jgi:hypothetical protein